MDKTNFLQVEENTKKARTRQTGSGIKVNFNDNAIKLRFKFH